MITSLRETKTRLSELISLAEKGEDILITVRGKPKARLTAVAAQPSLDTLAWKKELLKIQKRSVSRKTATPTHKIINEIREDRI